jgi:hypothetical protein
VASVQQQRDDGDHEREGLLDRDAADVSEELDAIDCGGDGPATVRLAPAGKNIDSPAE